MLQISMRSYTCRVFVIVKFAADTEPMTGRKSYNTALLAPYEVRHSKLILIKAGNRYVLLTQQEMGRPAGA